MGLELTTLVVIGTDYTGEVVINPTTIQSRPRLPPHSICIKAVSFISADQPAASSHLQILSY